MTTWCTGNSDPRRFGTSAEVFVRHLGTSAELSGHIGTGVEVSYGYFGTKEDTLAPGSLLRHCSYRMAGETTTI